jgi:hypothetical protein
MSRIPFIAVLSFAALAACEAKIGPSADKGGDGGEPANAAAPVSAEGKAEEGSFSIKAPGFDLKVDIPDAMAANAELDSDSKIFYPGASLSGMHVEAGQRSGGAGNGEGNGAVELRFTTADAPDKVAGWYRDPARRSGFTIASDTRDGDAFVIAGKQVEGDEDFTVRLAPRSGGGTDGRLLLTDKG